MQRLNIPMGSVRGGRRGARAVWAWGALLLAVVATIVAHGAFTRNGVTDAAPEDTELVLRFVVPRTGWEQLLSALDGITLVSNRPLSIQDLPGFVEGEFAIFVGKDGRRTLSVHTEEDFLPRQSLSAAGIQVQETGTHRFLLSDRKEGTSPYEMPRRSRLAGLAWPHGYLGDIAVPGLKTAGTIRWIEGGSLEWRFPKAKQLVSTTIPANGDKPIVFLATPAWTNDATFNLPSVESFVSSLFPWDGLALGASQGELAVAMKEGKEYFFAKFKQNSAITASRTDLLKLSSAVRTPTTRRMDLPDGDVVKEIIADPSHVTVETAVIGGHQVEKVAGGNEEELFSYEEGGDWIFTNDRSWIEADASTRVTGPCDGDLFGSRLDLLATAASRPNGYWSDAFSDVARMYQSVGVTNGFFSTIVRFCR